MRYGKYLGRYRDPRLNAIVLAELQPTEKLIATQEPVYVAFSGKRWNKKKKYWARLAAAFAQEYGFNPKVMVAQMNQESGLNPHARSSAGAQGIAQIMPGTAKAWGVNPWNPVAALRAAAKNMAGYYKTYRKQGHDSNTATKHALAAYNAGPGAVKKYKGVPPYKETRHYVTHIMQLASKD